MASIDESDLQKRLRDPLTRDKAFNDLVQLYQEKIYWVIRKIVLNHDDTNDVMQNTFLKAYRALENYRGEAKLYTWLYRIASNESLTFISNKRKRQTVDDDLRHLESDPYFDGNSLQHQLQKALHQLPDKQRLVFQMRYYEEMSYQDISDILQTSVGALKASYFHAVRKIEYFFKEITI